VALFQILLRALSSGFRRPAFFGRRQVDARAASLREADGDGLFGGSGAVLTLPYMLHLFPDKFACLGSRGFTFRFVPFRPFQRFLFRHFGSSSLSGKTATRSPTKASARSSAL
jgi:hypothetical protein